MTAGPNSAFSKNLRGCDAVDWRRSATLQVAGFRPPWSLVLFERRGHTLPRRFYLGKEKNGCSPEISLFGFPMAEGP